MTKTLWMVSRKNYNLNANKGFAIFLISKLITCFIGSFALTMTPQSIAHSLNGSEHTYWNLYLEGEVHSIWDLGVSAFKNAREMSFLTYGMRVEIFGRNQKNLIFWAGGYPCPILTLRKVCEGEFNVLLEWVRALEVRSYYMIKFPLSLP